MRFDAYVARDHHTTLNVDIKWLNARKDETHKDWILRGNNDVAHVCNVPFMAISSAFNDVSWMAH